MERVKEFKLRWNLIPACIYEHLLTFRGDDAFYDPAFGPGVYLFIHGNGRHHQVYYVGQSQEIGGRLLAHFKEWTRPPSNLHLPLDIDHFETDIHELYRNSGNAFKQEAHDFSREKRVQIGRRIMHNTYFAFALIEGEDQEWLHDVEAALHFAVLKYHGLPKAGWLGEKTSVVPERDVSIRNIYPSGIAEEVVAPSLPDEVLVRGGALSIVRPTP